MNFRDGTWDDGMKILSRLRTEQCRTVMKLGLNPEDLLAKAMSLGPVTTVLVNGEPAAMFGIQTETLLGKPKIWLITTSLVEKEPIAFLRWSRRFTKELHTVYGTLTGMVDIEFKRSRQWLRWCGFTEVREGEYIEMRYFGGH